MKNSIFYTLLLTSAALSSAADMADISGGTYRFTWPLMPR